MAAPAVLVLEPSPDLRRLLAMALRRAGYLVRDAAAFDAAAIDPPPTLAIVSDADESQVGSLLAAGSAILLMTDDPDSAPAALPAIGRPFEMRDLVDRVRSMIGGGDIATTAWPAATSLPRSSTAARPTVLVVDDDRFIRRLLVDLLDRAFRVLEAADGDEAFQLASTETVSLVISDALMPGVSGIDLARRLRATPATATIPILLLTGMDSSDLDISQVNAVISKPFEVSDLRAAIRRLVGTP